MFSTPVVSQTLSPYRAQSCFYGRVCLSLPLLQSTTSLLTEQVLGNVGLASLKQLHCLFDSGRLTFMLHLKPASAESVYREL